MLWAWRRFVTALSDLLTMRLLSVLAASGLAAGAFYSYSQLIRGRLSVFAVFVLSSPALLFYAQEARSYVFSLFGGIYIGMMFLSSLSLERGAKSSPVGIALTGIIGCLLCSVHIISILTAGYLLFSLALIAIRFRLWQISFLAGAMIIFGLLPGAMTTLLLTSGVQSAVHSFHITRRDALDSLVWNCRFLLACRALSL